ncbi:neuropeptide Y receptor type 5 [Hydra vulgaris]|uniref:neuropeptide Y receptor type 5 n=1 Tax=Hydra vulgaris TaxID=6087 RepID=UPI0006416552|nr:neuropeptide Y receptor type 5 [Hydra vulgaris]XP_047124832.1 neuropeptide Y receptor type 5 [Hydra vulgaris]XP_047124833.1 neuropeptide Y receptor type 5 [Hydra vulgaris]XP_047124834.1 neuropeptide Y receptor type 5 [Hydra vulgaris]
MSANTTQDESEEKWIKLTFTVTRYIILILGILGNALLIIALIKIRRYKKFVDKLIINSCAINVLLVSVSIPADLITRASQNYPFGDVGCKLLLPVSTYAVNTGVFTLLVIAFERWKVVAQPFSLINDGLRSVLIILTIHLCGIGTVIPYVVTLHRIYQPESNRLECNETWSYDSARLYTVALFAMQYVIPVPIMLAFYLKAWVIIQRRNLAVTRPMTPLFLNCEQSENLEITRKTFSFSHEVEQRKNSEKSTPLLPLISRQKSFRRSSEIFMNYIFPTSMIEPTVLQHKALERRFRQSRDLLRTFTVVVMVFVVFMLPNQIYWITLYFSQNKQNHIVYNVVYILTYANCVFNPWIYGGLNQRFRKDFRCVMFRISSVFTN